ncbi:MAG: hypothetical protein RIT25_2417 [Planctomycetota bacterium]
MRPFTALAAVAVLAVSLVAQAPTVRTILSSGTTSSRYDMVILGDGYTSAEQARFDQDCTSFLTALLQRPPYSTFASYINVHTVFRASTMSGANHPDTNPPLVRNPVYGSAYNTSGVARCLYISNTTLALSDAALAPANEGRVIVMVNDSRYGGCAAQFAVSYNGSSMNEVQIHEVGHSLAGLADEYDYPNQTYTGGEPGQANITASPSGQKWSHWWGTGGISATAFQGAGYYLYGLYRPAQNCLMRNLGVPLCAVCVEQTTRALNYVVTSIENPIPSTTNLVLQPGNTQQFSFNNIVPPANGTSVTWKLDGNVVAGNTGTTYQLDTTGMSLGRHTVSVTVTDQTPLVRSDPNGVMNETRTWNVDIVSPSACELRITDFRNNTVTTAPGSEIDISTTVRNEGPATSPSVALEHFASPDSALSTSDNYLGRVTVPSLAPGASTTIARRIRVPMTIRAGTQILFAQVDRTNVALEANENNNTAISALLATTPPCTPTLEFRDDLTWPKDAISIPAASGTARPTVIARCAAPGTAYLVVWGCSGTTPGTQLGSLTVPINQDACTMLGLQFLNTSVFSQFFGVLDSQGTGLATFAIPPTVPFAPGTGHFAAVLLDSTPSFSAVTNPVTITLQ